MVWSYLIPQFLLILIENIEYRFCIIEGPETVEDFAKFDLQEIQDNIRSRRNKIFLHMEEVRFNLSLLLYQTFSVRVHLDFFIALIRCEKVGLGNGISSTHQTITIFLVNLL